MYSLLSLLTLLLSCCFLLRALKPSGIAESVLCFFCLCSAHIITLGYILSFINRLSDVKYWALLGLIASIISAIIVWNRNTGLFIALPRDRWFSLSSLILTISSIRNWYRKDLSLFEKLVLSPLILTTLLLGILNLMVVVFAAPHNWDSLTYHLARVAYYIQHHNLDYFDANYWAQVIHPKNSSLLLLYTYLISGRNENLTQLVQYISYWVAVCSVYAIARKIGNSKAQSIFAAMVSALLIEWLMEATTTQNDLILTAYFGATVYFLFAFRETDKWKYIALAASCVGLAIGTKASAFLCLPSIGLLALYVGFQASGNFQKRVRNFAVGLICILLPLCIFAAPAGFIENYRHFGHPFGPKTVQTIHTFEGESISHIIRHGTKNLIRIGFDFFSLDGVPPLDIVKRVQVIIKSLPVKAVHKLGIDLEAGEATRAPFNALRPPFAHEDASYWGIMGFGLIWPVVFLSVVGLIKPTDIRILSVAAVLFLFFQAYAGAYDPWRGRYFTIAAVFAVPAVGVCLATSKRSLRAYLLFIVLAGSVSAISAVVLRLNSSLISFDYKDKRITSIFVMDRMAQLTRNSVDYSEPLKRFDELVPKNAVVAVFLPGDSPEYPLFGEHLTRTIIPINSNGLQPIPVNAGYLLYAEGFPCASTEDVDLGVKWHLRHLTDNNRRCP